MSTTYSAREDEFFDEDGNRCSQEISLEVVYEERIEEESLVEILGPRKWRIKI